MWIFTPQERKAILFGLTALIIGGGVFSYKRYNPEFAPELLTGKRATQSKAVWSSNTSRLANAASPSQEQAKRAPLKPNAKLNLNTATAQELERLPYIGPVLAHRIVDYRYQKGGFQSLEDLKQVKGIGEKVFTTVKPYLFLE